MVSRLRDDLIGVATTIAVILAVVAGGYLAVTQLGWRDTAGLLGFESSTIVRAPQSDCRNNPDLDGAQDGDDYVRCISDGLWIKSFLQACSRREETDLRAVARDGTLTAPPRCDEREQRRARELRGKVPRGTTVTAFLGRPRLTLQSRRWCWASSTRGWAGWAQTARPGTT